MKFADIDSISIITTLGRILTVSPPTLRLST